MDNITQIFNRLSLTFLQQIGAQQTPGLGICVSSSKAGEGKSTVALGLARQLVANSAYKVLLVDANFESPAIAKLLKLPHGVPGFADCLHGRAEINQAVQNIDGLHVLSAGVNSLVSDLFHTQLIPDFYHSLRKDYPIVIFDMASLNSSGANVLLQAADKTLLVVDATSTRREVAKAALDELHLQLPVEKIAGAILNKLPHYIPADKY